MPLLLKLIKPKKLEIGAFRLELLNALRTTGKVIEEEDYGAITATWKHKPKIEVVISLTGPGPVLLIGTDDEIFGYVSEGTRPHKIKPKRPGGTLYFQRGYTAKTRANVIGSVPGGSVGPMQAAKAVKHPGTEARNFDKVIQKKREKWFKRKMEDAMKTAAKKSGWS